MLQEIKNMDEFNPRYTKNGALKWQHINDGRNKKREFPMIPLDKIVIGKRKYEEENLKAHREQYERTHELVPVLVRNYDYKLKSGYELILLAQKLGMTEIPYIMHYETAVSRKPYEPVKIDLQVNKESLQSDLNLALTDLDLPVHFKIDADALAAELQAAVNKITDVKIDLHVNTDTIRSDIGSVVNDGSNETIDTTRYTQLQQLMGNINSAGATGQSTFQRFGGSLKEAFSTYTMANMLQDGIYKVVDAGKQGLETVKSFNDIKTDLAMATGESKTYINDLMQSYNELGQELGSVTSDVAQSADSWLRQGRTMSETNQLIKDSMVLGFAVE